MTSARYRNSRVARLAPTDAAVSSGRSSMKLVVTGPSRNCWSARMACRYGWLVDTPRTRYSARVRCMRRTTVEKSLPRQVTFSIIESKWGVISTPW